jgi:hypothetical protein
MASAKSSPRIAAHRALPRTATAVVVVVVVASRRRVVDAAAVAPHDDAFALLPARVAVDARVAIVVEVNNIILVVVVVVVVVRASNDSFARARVCRAAYPVADGNFWMTSFLTNHDQNVVPNLETKEKVLSPSTRWVRFSVCRQSRAIGGCCA